MEPLAFYQGAPPWHHCGDAVRFVLDLPLPTRRDDPPERRKEAALAALALYPDPDCTIWSDGSAKEGTIQGGGGAILELHREGRHIECVAPAGRVCTLQQHEGRVGGNDGVTVLPPRAATPLQLPRQERAAVL